MGRLDHGRACKLNEAVRPNNRINLALAFLVRAWTARGEFRVTAIDLLGSSICCCRNSPVASPLGLRLTVRFLVLFGSRLLLCRAVVSIASHILLLFILRRFRIGFFPFFAFAAEDHFPQT